MLLNKINDIIRLAKWVRKEKRNNPKRANVIWTHFYEYKNYELIIWEMKNEFVFHTIKKKNTK